MSAEKHSSMMSRTDRQNSSLADWCAVTAGPLSSGLFRPWALVLIGLSLSVTLWGFGYKLSRYYPHSDATSRSLLAKLWDKHQDVKQITAAAVESAQAPHSQPVLHVLLILRCQPPTAAQWPFLNLDELKKAHLPSQPVVPLRSPPSSIRVA